MRLDHLLSMENVVEVKRHFTVFDERIPRKTVVQFSGMDVKKNSLKLVFQTLRVHPFPFRTRKLSSAVSTILHGRLCGKIDQGQHKNCSTRVGQFLEPLWGCSSAGRAPALQAGGHGFESHHLHQQVEIERTQRYRLIAQQVRARA